MSRSKGRKYENELVELLNAMGLPAWRVPLSGALGGRFSSDVRVNEARIEVKMRSKPTGFVKLLQNLPSVAYLDGTTYLVIKLEHLLGLDIQSIMKKEVQLPSAIRGWLKNCDALAIRLPKRLIGDSGWMVVIKDSLLDEWRTLLTSSESSTHTVSNTTTAQVPSTRTKNRSSLRRRAKSQ